MLDLTLTHKWRVEEKKAFDALFSGVDKMQLPGFMEWEDNRHFNRALENERLYLQGMKDGAQLVFALLAAPAAPDDKHRQA